MPEVQVQLCKCMCLRMQSIAGLAPQPCRVNLSSTSCMASLVCPPETSHLPIQFCFQRCAHKSANRSDICKWTRLASTVGHGNRAPHWSLAIIQLSVVVITYMPSKHPMLPCRKKVSLPDGWMGGHSVCLCCLLHPLTDVLLIHPSNLLAQSLQCCLLSVHSLAQGSEAIHW